MLCSPNSSGLLSVPKNHGNLCPAHMLGGNYPWGNFQPQRRNRGGGKSRMGRRKGCRRKSENRNPYGVPRILLVSPEIPTRCAYPANGRNPWVCGSHKATRGLTDHGNERQSKIRGPRRSWAGSSGKSRLRSRPGRLPRPVSNPPPPSSSAAAHRSCPFGRREHAPRHFAACGRVSWWLR